MMIYEQECYAIRGALYEVYSVLGTGFSEEVYQEALERELEDRDIPFEPQKELQVSYKAAILDKKYRADVVCFGKIILELKAVKSLLPEHEAQIINYLHVSGFRLGLLINFHHYPKLDIRQYAN